MLAGKVARLVAQIRAALSAGVEFFVADHALLSTDPSRNIQPELPELCEHRPQVQCGQGAGAEAAAVVLADYGEGQLGLSRIPQPTSRFPAWTRECCANATRGSVSGVGHRGSEYGVVGSGANSR